MRNGYLRALLLGVAIAWPATDAFGQYMFLDTNGDGIYTDQDRLTTGTASVNVYLDTSHRRDGTEVLCEQSSNPKTINSYEIIFRVTSGALTYGNWSDLMGYSVSFGTFKNSTDLYVGRGSSYSMPPGRYKLGTLSVSGVTSNTSLEIVPSTPVVSYGYTSFGSLCEGNDFDNTLKLGTDWVDKDGLVYGCTASNPNNSAPVLDAPASVAGIEGQPLQITATASDPDASDDLFVLVNGQPGTLVLSGGVGRSPIAPQLNGTPGYSEAGSYAIRWYVGDGQCAFDSSTTVLTISNTDRPPYVSAPTTVAGKEGQLLTFSVTAGDPDGEMLESVVVEPLPPGAVLTLGGGQNFGYFSWTPGYSQSGVYTLVFTAQNALSASATTTLTIANTDRSPAVVAPSTETVSEGSTLSFGVSASDPDGETVVSLTAQGLPAGATFTPAPDNLSGQFHWTPSYSQSGGYTVTFVATNTATGAASTRITVTNVDFAPTLTLPGDQAVDEGALLSFSVTAVDPDGDVFYSFYASGQPFGAEFLVDYPYGSTSTGQFRWTPTYSQAGDYTVYFYAYNGGSATGTVRITVRDVNLPPVISAPNIIYSPEGARILFDITASDADADPVFIEIQNRPPGATFYDLGNTHASFEWTPTFGQSGTYTVTFTARDVRGGIASPKATTIVVDNLNRAPIASAGGPYSGVVGVAVPFDGTGSVDPDGDALQYHWDYGDGGVGVGGTPSHVYSSGGRFTVTLSVSDGTASGSAVTTASVQDVFPARAFTTNSYSTIRLGSGKATWCAEIEPVGDAYLNTSVVISTVTLSYGAGTIYADRNKLSIGADKDGNGVQELEACFSKADLRTLFAGLPKGTTTVTAGLEGALTTGGRFKGNVTMDVVNSGQSLAASVSPNPLNPTGQLTFRTFGAGRLRVSLYDLQGRLIRRYLEDSNAAAGYHDVRIDGRGDSGARLPSGVYFYRIEAAEGEATGRVIVAR